jgi:hypothetical protein
VLVVGLLSTRALAEGTPVVNLVQPRFIGGGAAVPDGKLPASKDFLLRYPMPADTEDAAGILRVWPRAEGIGASATDCGQPPEPSAAVQTYTFSMLLAGDSPSKYLQAQVPPLQVGQTFCFQVTVTRSLSKAEFQGMSKVAAKAMVDAMFSAPHAIGECYGNDAASLRAFERALDSALRAMNVAVGDISLPAQLAFNHYVDHQAGQCRAMVAAHGKRIDVEEIKKARLRVMQLRREVDGLPTLQPFGSPLVKLADAVIPAENVLELGLADPELVKAEMQLRARKGGDAQWNTVLDAWADVLAELAAAAPDQKKATLANIRTRIKDRKLPGPPSLELWNGKAFVSLDSFKKERLQEAEALASKTFLFARSPAAAKQWVDLFSRIVQAQQESTALEQDFEARETEATTRRTEFQTVLANALATEDVRRNLVRVMLPAHAAPVAGAGETPFVGNFASPDFGVLLAFPGFDTWALPYVGVNVYFTAVDRTISPVRLTGTPGQKFLQRFSLTLGVTLSDPSTPGLSIKEPVLNQYPVVAAGYRLTQYTRIVGGALFYTIEDPNPASAGTTLRVSGFVGASIDADIIRILTKSLGGSEG